MPFNRLVGRFGMDRQARSPVSYYPKPMFHGIRLAQLISSIIVFSIMAYFISAIRHDGYSVPWTFIWIVAASVGSFLVLAFTMILHCCTGLHAHLNVFLNGGLFVLWALSWSLLTWYMGYTLRNYCNIDNWNEELGIMICRIYKALFTFTLTGLVSTIAALGLDIFVLRHHSRRGVYRLQDVEVKTRGMPSANTAYEPTHGAFPNAHLGPTNYADGGIRGEPRLSEAWDANARPSFEPHANAKDAERLMGHDGHDDQPYRDTAYDGVQGVAPNLR